MWEPEAKDDGVFRKSDGRQRPSRPGDCAILRRGQPEPGPLEHRLKQSRVVFGEARVHLSPQAAGEREALPEIARRRDTSGTGGRAVAPPGRPPAQERLPPEAVSPSPAPRESTQGLFVVNSSLKVITPLPTDF